MFENLKLQLNLKLVALFMSFAVISSVQAQERPQSFGLGIIIGSPSAITGKSWLTSETAFDFGLAVSYDDSFLIYGDYLIHYPGALGRSSRFISELTPYFGIGGSLVVTTRDRRFDDRYLGRRSGSVGLGLRIPLGIEWLAGDPALGVFIEIVPGLSVIPTTSGLAEGGVGVRYYF